MTYIVLFRGINVGGNKVVRMEVLRKMLTDAGFGNVMTYIQSGNVVLTSDMPAEEVAKTIGAAFLQTFGFSSRPSVRSLSEWQHLIEQDPFADARSEGKQMHVVVLEGEPPEEALKALEAVADTEQIVLRGDALYLFTPDGFGRSKVAEALDRVLKVPLTARNWNTVLKLASMAQEASTD